MRTLSTLAVLLAATSVAAQTRESCSSGPGTAFGIVAYQCANCGFKSEQPGHPSYSFFAEPVVLETTRLSLVNVGDVIEAVNGKPITTSAGAEQFAYPAGGVNTITVRRGRDRQVLSVSIPGPSCDADASQIQYDLDDVESVEVIKGQAALARYGSAATNGVVVITTKPGRNRVHLRLPPLVADTVNGVVQIRIRGRGETPNRATDPIYVIDGVVVDPKNPGAVFGTPKPPDNTGKFGFAVSCKPSCTPATASEGTLHYTYYKYDGFPPIVAVRAGSVAERAGLRVGDVVTKVEGHPITDESGAKVLTRLDWTDRVRLTVRRDGKDFDVLLKTP